MTSADRETKPRDWIISVVVHVVAGALLIWLTPMRQLVLPTSQPTPSSPPPPDTFSQSVAADPQRVEQVVKAIAEKQADNAEATVTKLLDSEKQVDGMVKTRLDALKQQTAVIAAAAPQAALDQMKAIAQSQADAAAAQQKLTEKIAALAAQAQAAKQANDSAAMQKTADDLAQTEKDAEQSRESVKQNQVAAQDGQDKAAQLLKFVASNQADSSGAQDAANTAQSAATDSQRQAGDHAEGTAKSLQAALDSSQKATEAKAQAAQAQATLAQAAQQEADATKKVDDATAQLKTATQAAVDARAKAKQSAVQAKHDPTQATQAQTDATAAQTADAAVTTARKELDTDKHAMGPTKGARLAAETKVRQAQNQADRMSERANTAFTAAGDPAQLTAAQQKANQDQADAQKAQADAMAKLGTAVAQATNGTSASPADASATPAMAPEPDAASMQGKDLGKLFDAAKDTEERITEKYKMFRAAELASIRKITLGEAMKDTEVARPNREKVDTKLLASDGKNTDLGAYKAEVLKANQQMASMNSLSADMLASMRGQEAQSGTGTVDVSNWLKSQSDAAAQQQSAATATDIGIVGKDLTDGPDAIKSASGGADPTPTGPPPQREFAHGAPELPTMDYRNIKPFATRRIGANGAHYNDWIYVDSWYVIGPFPNEGRRNIYTKFPPESIVDLNATYIGKNNQPIRWRYQQWDSPAIKMAHDVQEAPAIYYTYTELNFDQPEDLWIATGSDDKGVMWLNDLMIWNSGDNLKSWAPNEGYRKVHFQKGVNRILYRLENGQLAAELSLMISMKGAGK